MATVDDVNDINSASRIVRTTIDIDDPILKDLKRLQRREGKSLRQLILDLLAQALATERRGCASPEYGSSTRLAA